MATNTSALLHFPFPSLVPVDAPPRGARLGLILGGSLSIHALLVALAILLPLFFSDAVPEAREGGLRAFFATPPDIAAPPPPPPPPAPALATRPRAPSLEVVRPSDHVFTAPLEVPNQIIQEPTDLGGGDDGVFGGVEGGVPGGVVGGVVGGIVGGLPREAPAEPVNIVRVGGRVAAPKLVHTVSPVYPDVARLAHLSGIVVLEAVVGVDGKVEAVKTLDANPVLEQAAIDAVEQWRYQPLLLNGVPTRFILTVTLTFRIQNAVS